MLDATISSFSSIDQHYFTKKDHHDTLAFQDTNSDGSRNRKYGDYHSKRSRRKKSRKRYARPDYKSKEVISLRDLSCHSTFQCPSLNCCLNCVTDNLLPNGQSDTSNCEPLSRLDESGYYSHATDSYLQPIASRYSTSSTLSTPK